MQHIQASPSCIAHVEERYLKQIIRLGQEACRRPMPMICVPPLPQKPFAFGDLVPLGFLLRALRSGSHDPEIARGLTAFINAKKQGALWAFHSGHLITATDSALILLGLDDVEAVQTLQMFYDGHGGYYPQLWSEEPRPDHMLLKNSYRHWCQSDYGTTCLIRGLRQQHHLACTTSLSYLSEGFEQRSGLYFANPYLVDWALALALKDDPQAAELRMQLLLEVLTSQAPDGTFGCFDRACSIALAVLTLKTLGYGGQAVMHAQEWIANTSVTAEKARPFYSSEILDDQQFSLHELLLLKALNEEQVARVGAHYHAISYYEDHAQMINCALIFLALQESFQEHG
ncbi:MAG: hypothetical protein RBT80_19595, partial [Candidatus Vecturithrix sp.]|nr:hypothetical protein [Candidatus Vecturithrix sp.]